jgi:probable HAF family extracellular repeat protein
VGTADSVNGREPFRWTAAGGMKGLGSLGGKELRSEAQAVSADGSVVVGFADTPDGKQAFIWDAAHGTRLLKKALAEVGCDVGKWQPATAMAISGNGRYIVGVALNPDEHLEAFMASLVAPLPAGYRAPPPAAASKKAAEPAPKKAEPAAPAPAPSAPPAPKSPAPAAPLPATKPAAPAAKG